jgi:hypothetical protein
MNTPFATRFIAAAAFGIATSGAAFAQEATYEYPQALSAVVSRSAVQAEAVQALASRSLRGTDAGYNVLKSSPVTLSRAEVKADLMAALAHGDIQRLTAESNAFSLELTGAQAPLVLAAR